MGHRVSKCSVDSHVVLYDGARAKPTGVRLKFNEFSTTAPEIQPTQKKNPRVATRMWKRSDADEKPGLVFVEDPTGGVWMKPRDIA